MEIPISIVQPIVIVIITAILGGYITINIKYSETKEEALHRLKLLIVRIFTLLWVIYLSSSLWRQVTSTEPITRFDTFMMILNSFALFLMLISIVMDRIVSIMERMADNQDQHIQATKMVVERMKHDDSTGDS